MFVFRMFFFFKQKTAYEMRISDWSSDVCSSDLLDIEYRRLAEAAGAPRYIRVATAGTAKPFIAGLSGLVAGAIAAGRPLCSGAGGRICPADWNGCPQALE